MCLCVLIFTLLYMCLDGLQCVILYYVYSGSYRHRKALVSLENIYIMSLGIGGLGVSVSYDPSVLSALGL